MQKFMNSLEFLTRLLGGGSLVKWRLIKLLYLYEDIIERKINEAGGQVSY